MKETVVVSKHWKNPDIKVSINDEGLTMQVSLDDFCRALAAELGVDPEAAVKSCATVIEKIKEASVHG